MIDLCIQFQRLTAFFWSSISKMMSPFTFSYCSPGGLFEGSVINVRVVCYVCNYIKWKSHHFFTKKYFIQHIIYFWLFSQSRSPEWPRINSAHGWIPLVNNHSPPHTLSYFSFSLPFYQRKHLISSSSKPSSSESLTASFDQRLSNVPCKGWPGPQAPGFKVNISNPTTHPVWLYSFAQEAMMKIIFEHLKNSQKKCKSRE